MKLKFNKKSIKELSPNSKRLASGLTPQVAGGRDTFYCESVNYCNSDASCWTVPEGKRQCIFW
ncbi:hypothetical protein ACSLBF_04560 [Pseudoalteromonas sp. T1lg65]|uniref:hypothetical protein n=1 Tax=Pseudoalteromonas sp. T1lg65 TaxID=2077101 RepID=UPI003F7B2358